MTEKLEDFEYEQTHGMAASKTTGAFEIRKGNPHPSYT